MNEIPLQPNASRATDKKLVTTTLSIFLAVTFTFTWLVLGLAVLSANRLIALSLSSAVLISIATLGPALGAVAAAGYESGRVGVRNLIVQAGRWRVGSRWYFIVLIGPALVMLVGFLLWRALGGPSPPAAPLSAWLSVPVLIIALLVPALFEEVGWRGLALPRLQPRYGWLLSSLILVVKKWLTGRLPCAVGASCRHYSCVCLSRNGNMAIISQWLMCCCKRNCIDRLARWRNGRFSSPALTSVTN